MQEILTPEELASRVFPLPVDTVDDGDYRRSGRTAIMFGREKAGLRKEVIE